MGGTDATPSMHTVQLLERLLEDAVRRSQANTKIEARSEVKLCETHPADGRHAFAEEARGALA